MKNIIGVITGIVIAVAVVITLFIALGGSPAAEFGCATGSHIQWDIQDGWTKGDGCRAAIFVHKGKKVLAYDADSEEGWRKVRTICKQHPDIKHVRIVDAEADGVRFSINKMAVPEELAAMRALPVFKKY